MSDYVPDASKQVAEQIDKSNEVALSQLQGCLEAVVDITSSPLSIASGGNAASVQGAKIAEPTASSAAKQVFAQTSKCNQGALVQACSGTVNINITGSPLTITTGDNAFNVQGDKVAEPTVSSDIVPKVAAINKRSWETTSVKITEDCNDEKLNEPDFQVYPQMRKVDDYYKGGYAEVESEIVVEEQTRGFRRIFRRVQKKVLKNQCIKERGFDVKRATSEGDSVSIEGLLASIMKENVLKAGEKLAATAVVASAGSGKTTLLRRLARQVMTKNGITEDNNFYTSNQGRFNMVRYIELKNVQDKKSISVADFLFGGMFKDKKDTKETYEWLLNNQSKVVLFLDGLDQTRWKIDKKQQVNIEPHHKSSPATIMYNLLSRNLLPHLQIMISSREYAISELQANSRPQIIVTLTGLSREDAKRLFIALVGINGANAWNKLNKSRGLLHFISIPVFLILSAIVMSRDSDSPPPDTVTGLFARIIEILPSTENIQQRDRIIEIMNKLKKMAHEGMVQGRVTFREDDLKKHGLSVEDVKDLMIKVPGKNILSRYLLESHRYILFFFHQSFQEFLSACFISEMNLGKLKKFNQKNLHEDRWSVVRRFSCGLIHDENLSLGEDLHKIPNKKAKQQILRKHLASYLENAEGYQILELYGALYESNSCDLVNSLVGQIMIKSVPLGPDAAHTLSSMMARCENLDLVHLKNCGINDNLLRIMGENMKRHKLHVKTLRIPVKGFTITGLNFLLENMTVDTLETEIEREAEDGFAALNWEDIREVSLKWQYQNILMTKISDSIIEINNSSWKFSATFNMKKRMLQFDAQTTSNDCKLLQRLVNNILLDVKKIFKSNAVTIVLKERSPQQYWKYDEKTLQSMQNWKIEGKIKKLLLDCYSLEDKLDRSLIASTVRLLQIELLDIAVNNDNRGVIAFEGLQDELCNCGCELNIHWCCRALEKYNFLGFTELASSISRNPVDNLRLYIDLWSRDFGLEYLENFIKECKVKNLSMIFITISAHSTSDKQKFMRIAESLGIHLEFRRGGRYMFADDAWEELDKSTSA